MNDGTAGPRERNEARPNSLTDRNDNDFDDNDYGDETGQWVLYRIVIVNCKAKLQDLRFSHRWQ
jgi:hypothetical protein